MVLEFMQKLPEKASGYKLMLQEKNVNWLCCSYFFEMNIPLIVCFLGLSMQKYCGLF
jgi:hypothetical protein